VLEPGRPIERDLTGEESHTYQLALEAGEYATVTVEQRGIDVVVRLMEPGGTLITEFDGESRRQGRERVGIVADAAGAYRLAIRARYPKGAIGRYAIGAAERRPATSQDRAAYEARRLGSESVKLSTAGKYAEARTLVARALELTETAAGPDASYVGALAIALAGLERTMGDYASAERTYQRAVAVSEKSLGREHPQTALALERFGLLYRERNDYGKAEKLLQEALDIDEKTLGHEHPRVVNALMSISLLHSDRQDFRRASAELQEALAIAEKALEPDSGSIIALRINLGDLLLNLNDYDRAEAQLSEAVQVLEKKFGPEDPRIEAPLLNLGIIARERKQYPRALEFLWRAEAVNEKVLGARHARTASTLISIANVYRSQGDYAKALEVYHRAREVAASAAGPYHNTTMLALLGIGRTHAAQGNSALALEYQTRVDQILEKQIGLNMTVGSERARLAYVEGMEKRTDRTISLNTMGFPADQGAADQAALVVLQRKGRVFDAIAGNLAALRERLNLEDQWLLDDLGTTTARLATLALSGPGKTPPDDYQKQLAALEATHERLEGAISERSAEFRAQSQVVTLGGVRAAIPVHAALIEFATYHPFDARAATDADSYGDAHYVAYILRRDSPVRWKDLGPAKDVDAAIARLRNALSDPARTDVRQLARAADAKIMQPIRASLDDATQLLISPDGELNLIPFEALEDERGRYLIECYAITYLTSGRDLLRMQVPRVSKSEPVVIADPSFGEPAIARAEQPRSKATSSSTMRRSVTTAQDLSSVYFARLAGTAREGRAIQSLFPDAQLLTGPRATKAALTHVMAPRILHVATHGFFLQDASHGVSDAPARAGGSRVINTGVTIENPLLRSGLAFAGANVKKPGSDDGVLTALEASGVNLWGTRLVVLSACDTGVGEVKNGEGVYGLRRAFFLAGTETLVMSLWPVSDYDTRELMIAYYTGLKSGLGRGEALRQAKLAMLQRNGRQHPFRWASFIQSGEWANLDGQR